MDNVLSESSQEDDDSNLFTEQEIWKEMGFSQSLVSRVNEQKITSNDKGMANSKLEKENHQNHGQTSN